MGRPNDQHKRDLAFEKEWIAATKVYRTAGEYAKSLGFSNETSLCNRRRRVEQRIGRPLPGFSGRPDMPIASMTPKRARALLNHQAMVETEHVVRPSLQDEDLPVEELWRRREEETARRLRNDKAKELVPVHLKINGPYGIALIGDPHIDSPGAHVKLLREHAELIRNTEGLYGLCVGDLQDGWIGRLARLWAEQGIAAKDSQRMVDYWLGLMGDKLLAIVEGNHDCWLHNMSGRSPIEWIAGHGVLRERHGVRLRFHHPSGHHITINLRHDFHGHSMWNAAHGGTKAQAMAFRDDVAVAGHTHQFGLNVRMDPETRRPMYAVRVGSYKWSDEYAKEKGLWSNNVSECPVVMVDPDEPDSRHRLYIEPSVSRAAKVLGYMRAERQGSSIPTKAAAQAAKTSKRKR